MSNGIERRGDSVSPDARVKGQRSMLALPPSWRGSSAATGTLAPQRENQFNVKDYSRRPFNDPTRRTGCFTNVSIRHVHRARSGLQTIWKSRWSLDLKSQLPSALSLLLSSKLRPLVVFRAEHCLHGCFRPERRRSPRKRAWHEQRAFSRWKGHIHRCALCLIASFIRCRAPG